MSEVTSESNVNTRVNTSHESLAISAPPPLDLGCPSFSRSPLLVNPESAPAVNRTPAKSPISRMMTPVASPMKKVFTSMHGYLEEVGHLTKFDPQDAWLPITESRNGNAYYAAFHSLSSGIGFQALVLPLAFTALGWIWGIICLSVAFVWQLYTLWLLIQLHEADNGMRYSRYLRLSVAAFGEKLGKILSLFPIMYLSGGTCVTLIMFASGTMKIFYQIVRGESGASSSQPITTVEWYLVFTFTAVILAQLPNLNSIAGVSLIGAITATAYLNMIWIVSVCKGRSSNVSYGPSPIMTSSYEARLYSVLNALGMIAFSFRGHNLVLEIQGTMQTSKMQPSKLPMWQGVKFSYLIIALCLFPLAICGYWAYGNDIHGNEGVLKSLYKHHGHDTSRVLLGTISLLVVINSLSSFQIYAMPVVDNFEFRYTSHMKKPCPRWVRSGIRVFFGCLALFIAVAFPFLPSLAGLLGGIALPITLAYPCLMWIQIKKPQRWSIMWGLNWALGCLGLLLSVLLVTGAIWSIVIMGLKVHFFKPE